MEAIIFFECKLLRNVSTQKKIHLELVFQSFFSTTKKKNQHKLTHQFVRIFIEKYREKIELYFFIWKTFFFAFSLPTTQPKKNFFFYSYRTFFIFSSIYIFCSMLSVMIKKILLSSLHTTNLFNVRFNFSVCRKKNFFLMIFSTVLVLVPARVFRLQFCVIRK